MTLPKLLTYRRTFILTAALLLPSCSRPDGPPRYTLTGTITYQDKPIPKGGLLLTPDSKVGNHGPATIALIEGGKYTTPEGKGVVGGAYVAMVSGYDGVPYDRVDSESPSGMIAEPNGKPLFPPQFRMVIKLPAHDASQRVVSFDIEVPGETGGG